VIATHIDIPPHLGVCRVIWGLHPVVGGVSVDAGVYQMYQDAG